jgi:hypothetical protein
VSLEIIIAEYRSLCLRWFHAYVLQSVVSRPLPLPRTADRTNIILSLDLKICPNDIAIHFVDYIYQFQNNVSTSSMSG